MKINLKRKQIIKDVHIQRKNRAVKAKPNESYGEASSWQHLRNGTLAEMEEE